MTQVGQEHQQPHAGLPLQLQAPRSVSWLEVSHLLRQIVRFGAVAAQSIPWACCSPFPRKSRWKSESLVQPNDTPPGSSVGSDRSSKRPPAEAGQQAQLRDPGLSSLDLLDSGLPWW